MEHHSWLFSVLSQIFSGIQILYFFSSASFHFSHKFHESGLSPDMQFYTPKLFGLIKTNPKCSFHSSNSPLRSYQHIKNLPGRCNSAPPQQWLATSTITIYHIQWMSGSNSISSKRSVHNWFSRKKSFNFSISITKFLGSQWMGWWIIIYTTGQGKLFATTIIKSSDKKCCFRHVCSSW